jgi:hypothetical protein
VISVASPGAQDNESWVSFDSNLYEDEIENEEPDAHPSFMSENWVYILQIISKK